MNHPKSFASLVLALSLYLISCSSSDKPVIDPVAESFTLQKIFVLDITKSAPFDTMMRYQFSYDNSGRLSWVSESSFEPTTWVYTVQRKLHYFYHGTDTLPYRAWDDKHSFLAFPTDKNHMLKHDAFGKLAMDSSVDVRLQTNDTSIYKHTYLHHGDGHADSTFTYRPSYTENAERFYSSRDANNNVTAYITEYGNKEVTLVEYDNRINPLYKLSPVKVPYFTAGAYPTFNTGYTPQKKNIKKLTINSYDASGTTVLQTRVIDYLITYHSNGMPASTRAVSTPVHADDRFMHVFVY